MINKRYNEFLPSLQASEELLLQVDAVSKEMDALKNCIETEVCGKLLVSQRLYESSVNDFNSFTLCI